MYPLGCDVQEGMSKAYRPATAPEAINNPHRYQGAEVTRRSAEEHEEAILAHQHRIDIARNHGRLRSPNPSPQEIRQCYFYEPGYEKTPRGLKLGQGLGYDTCPSKKARKAEARRRRSGRPVSVPRPGHDY